MKLSIFTTITNSTIRGDNCIDALNCYQDLVDELIIINGGEELPANWYKRDPGKRLGVVQSPWPQEFNWPFIGQQFQKGYEVATGDWVIRMDLDYIFHEKDFAQIREACEANPNSPGLSFWKYQFILPDRYNLKSRVVLAVNKKLCGDRIKFNSGGDLCQPSLDGVEIVQSAVPEARVPFYNYEKMTKTVDQIMDDCGRMERAYQRHFGTYQMGSDGTNESAFDQYIRLIRGRFSKDQEFIKLKMHPKYVQDTISQLNPRQFGYEGFGLLDNVNSYAQGELRN
ncbi:MAG: hypothetical protein EPO02_13435 [Nitrospirae bacterium]|nr:MAG: hypothetical protein EPO02_13435 [Nitrospirota bacterium]